MGASPEVLWGRRKHEYTTYERFLIYFDTPTIDVYGKKQGLKYAANTRQHAEYSVLSCITLYQTIGQSI